jgi:PAS domain S-box-containing protein
MRDFYKSIVETSPIGYAFHKVLCNEEGEPCDYEFLEVNHSFESLTGLKASDIIGKSAVTILPGLRDEGFDWVKAYGEIAMHGGSMEFEQYARTLNRYYRVKAYSPEKYYFITLFIDITEEKNHALALDSIITLSQESLEIHDHEIDYQKRNDEFLRLTGAKYAIFNLFEEDGKSFTSKAISGDLKAIKEITAILGYELKDKRWENEFLRAEKIKADLTTRFASLMDLVGNTYPKSIVHQIEKILEISEVVIIKIIKNEAILGDFVIFMAKGETFKQDALAELYAQQIGMNITRDRTEKLLNQERNFTEAIFQSIPGYIYVYDKEGKLVRWNKKHEEMTGYSTEEMADMTLDKWFDGEDAKRVAMAVEKVFKTGFGEIEADLIVKGGRKIPIYSNGVPLTLDGKDYFTGIGIDVSTRKKYETELIETKEYFELMFNSNPDAFLVARYYDGVIIDVNEGFTRLSGHSRDEVIGNSSLVFSFFENQADRQRMLAELKEKGFCSSTELSFKRQDGSVFAGLLSAKRITLKGVACVFCNIRDITERKLAEKAIQENAYLFHSLFDNMSSGAAIYRVLNDGAFGKDYIVQDFNQASLIIEGKHKSDVIGKSIYDLRPNIDQYGLISSLSKRSGKQESRRISLQKFIRMQTSVIGMRIVSLNCLLETLLLFIMT